MIPSQRRRPSVDSCPEAPPPVATPPSWPPLEAGIRNHCCSTPGAHTLQEEEVHPPGSRRFFWPRSSSTSASRKSCCHQGDIASCQRFPQLEDQTFGWRPPPVKLQAGAKVSFQVKPNPGRLRPRPPEPQTNRPRPSESQATPTRNRIPTGHAHCTGKKNSCSVRTSRGRW